MSIICADCGCECERNGRRQKRCQPCAKLAAARSKKEWSERNRDKEAARNVARRDEMRARAREWYRANPERAKAQADKWYAENKQRAVDRALTWNRQNPERRKEIQRESAKRRREANPEEFKLAKQQRRANAGYRLNDAISSQVRIALKGRKSGWSWEVLVGFTLEDLIDHLSARFTEGMTLENFGQWHIDHIRPVASFSFSSPDDADFKRCWALNNLQPLWAQDNIVKSSRWNGALIRRQRAAVEAAN